MPQFRDRHFFGPLGCRDTDMVAMAWGAWSTAGDIARVGQMLLNRGAYGRHRFFREETFAQLLPRPLSETIGEGVGGVYGLGSTYYTDDGLGKGTFGHSAASGATLRIDPENELVIVITRNEGGRNYDKYHPQFLKAIVDGMAR